MINIDYYYDQASILISDWRAICPTTAVYKLS